jgi:hypothetical protein
LLAYRTAGEGYANLQPQEVKDLIKQHSKKVAVGDAGKLNKEDKSEDSDIRTKSDPNFHFNLWKKQ